MADPIRLNIGAGGSNLPGFLPIDAALGHDALHLDYPDGSVDEVYSSHCLEHLHHSQTYAAITEWVRVLRPGGRLRIAVPDFQRVLDDYHLGKMAPEMLAAWMHGSRDDDLDRHRSVLTEDLMVKLMRGCGLEGIQRFEAEHEDCSRLEMSMNLEGFKREVRIPREPKVTMVLSTPRVGFVDFYQSVAGVAKELGWNLRQWGGTEWGRGLTWAVVEAIELDNPDYLMFLDYDSVFTADDCRALLDIMQRRPEVAALYPVEAHRHVDLPLGFNSIFPAGYAKGDEVTRVQSGHFGCTIVRRQVFDAIPQPWFMTIPHPVTLNMADKGGLDADIYFWYQLGLYGLGAYQANNVVIGHMEWCVKWPGERGMIWQPIQHYRRHGKHPKAEFNPDYWLEKVRPKQPAGSAEPASAG